MQRRLLLTRDEASREGGRKQDIKLAKGLRGSLPLLLGCVADVSRVCKRRHANQSHRSHESEALEGRSRRSGESGVSVRRIRRGFWCESKGRRRAESLAGNFSLSFLAKLPTHVAHVVIAAAAPTCVSVSVSASVRLLIAFSCNHEAVSCCRTSLAPLLQQTTSLGVWMTIL